MTDNLKKETIWDEIILRRMLDELVLVGVLKLVDRNGTEISRDTIIKHLGIFIELERKMIKKHGRKEAARVYGRLEGRSSSIETVNFVLSHDFISYYTNLGECNG